MKLSDAIMLNGMTKPQGRGESSVKSIDAPCAIGGALQAIGKQWTGYTSTVNYTRFQEAWPWVSFYGLVKACPVCKSEPIHAMESIWHLNDVHEWTRQQIAEWVARIEPQEPEQTIEELVESAEVVND